MIKAIDRHIVINLSCIGENYTQQQVYISLFQWFHNGTRHTNSILQFHSENSISYPYNRPDTRYLTSAGQIKILSLRAGLAACPLGQVRYPALRADQIPCPGGRSEIPWGQVSDHALRAGQIPHTALMSVQVKCLTPKGMSKTLPLGQVRHATLGAAQRSCPQVRS